MQLCIFAAAEGAQGDGSVVVLLVLAGVAVLGPAVGEFVGDGCGFEESRGFGIPLL